MAPSRGDMIIKLDRQFRSLYWRPLARGFACSSAHASGHNRWSKIKHDKGKNDALKNRQRSIFSKEIMTASKLFGPEPNMNPRLADLISKAKKEGFAKASIEAAIARGQGRSVSGTSLENLTVEGMLPGTVGVIVECETDNRLRTLQNVRLAMKEAGGSASPSAFLFEKRGRVSFGQKDGVGVEEVLEAALEAGATDVEEIEGDGGIVVFCDSGDTRAVGEAVATALNLEIVTSEIVWHPNEDTRVAVGGERAAEDLGAFMEDLQDKESTVSAISMNVTQGDLTDDSWNELQTRLTS